MLKNFTNQYSEVDSCGGGYREFSWRSSNREGGLMGLIGCLEGFWVGCGERDVSCTEGKK